MLVHFSKKKKKKINEVIYFVYTINPFLGG